MKSGIVCLGSCGLRDSGVVSLTLHLGTRYTANNFNAPMARNAKLTIVEVSIFVCYFSVDNMVECICFTG